MAEKDKINIGALGAGVVGGSVLDYYYKSRDRITQMTGSPLEISRVLVRDSQKARNVSIPDGVLTTSLDDVVLDPSINIVVSLLGDEDFERYAISRSLAQRKYVITANKVVVAKHGPELFSIARQHGVNLMYVELLAANIKSFIRGIEA